MPQLTMLGSPRPRNDRADSTRIAVATITDDIRTIGGMALGRICVTMILELLMPMATQASTNSCCRNLRNSARVSRAIAGHVTSAMARITLTSDGPSIVTRTSASMMLGTV